MGKTVNSELNKGLGVEILEVPTEGTSKRFSDAKLEMFKDIILDKIKVAKETLAINKPDGNDTNDTSPTFKVLEEGQETLSKEEQGKLMQRQRQFIKVMEFALGRVSNKTFGQCHCEKCNGRLMSEERLRCAPGATKCVDNKKN